MAPDRAIRSVAAAAAMILAAGAAQADTARISIDRDERHQTIRAWDAAVDLFWPQMLAPYRDEVFDSLLDEVGISRLTVGVFSGAENTDRSFEDYLADRIDNDEWRGRRFMTVNDDGDPFHINWPGFDFANLDWRIEKTVLPLLEKAKARGRRLEISLSYIAATKENAGGTYIHAEPEEYAEFILAAFLHLQEKYGIVPDAVEALAGPEAAPDWTPEKLGRAIVAASRRLQEAGFRPHFIAPSVDDARNAVAWIDGIAAVPGAMASVREFSYHRNRGGRNPVIEEIGAAAARLGIDTFMAGLWAGGASADVLYSDLVRGNVAAWQGDTVWTHHEVDPALPKADKLVLKQNARYFRQYTDYVHPGDVRIGADSSNRRLAVAAAFLGTDGEVTVVIDAAREGQVEIPGLPAGTYYVSYAVEAGSGRIEQPFAVVEGTPLIVEMPGKGVVTVTSRDE